MKSHWDSQVFLRLHHGSSDTKCVEQVSPHEVHTLSKEFRFHGVFPSSAEITERQLFRKTAHTLITRSFESQRNGVILSFGHSESNDAFASRTELFVRTILGQPQISQGWRVWVKVVEIQMNDAVNDLLRERRGSAEAGRLCAEACRERKRQRKCKASHVICSVRVQVSKEREFFLLWVDLAEHAAHKMEQTRFVNQSLLTLGNVVCRRAAGSYVPYRDSKLTSVLKPVVEAPCQLMVLAHVNDDFDFQKATISALEFCQQVVFSSGRPGSPLSCQSQDSEVISIPCVPDASDTPASSCYSTAESVGPPSRYSPENKLSVDPGVAAEGNQHEDQDQEEETKESRVSSFRSLSSCLTDEGLGMMTVSLRELLKQSDGNYAKLQRDNQAKARLIHKLSHETIEKTESIRLLMKENAELSTEAAAARDKVQNQNILISKLCDQFEAHQREIADQDRRLEQLHTQLESERGLKALLQEHEAEKEKQQEKGFRNALFTRCVLLKKIRDRGKRCDSCALLGNEITTLRQALSHSQTTGEELGQCNEHLRHKVKTLEQTLDTLEKENVDIKNKAITQQSALELEASSHRERAAELEQDKLQLDSQVRDLRERTAGLEQEKLRLDSQLGELVERAAGHDQEKLQLDLQVMELRERAAELEQDKLQLDSQVRDLRERTARLEQEKLQLETDLQSIRSETEDATCSLTQEKNTLEDERNHLQAEILSVQHANKELTERVNELEKERTESFSKQEESEHLKTVLETKIEELQKTVRMFERENSSLREEAKVSALDHELALEQQQAKLAAEMEKNEKAQADLTSTIQSLGEAVAASDAKCQEFQSKLYQVSEEKDLLRIEMENSAMDYTTALQEKAARILQLEDEYSNVCNQVDEKDSLIHALNAKLERHIRQEKESVTTVQVKALEQEKEALAKRVASLEKSLQESRERCKDLETGGDETQRALAEKIAMVQSLKDQLCTSETRCDEMRTEATQAKADLRDAKRAVEEAQERAKALEIRQAVLESQRELYDKHVKSMEENMRVLREQCEKATSKAIESTLKYHSDSSSMEKNVDRLQLEVHLLKSLNQNLVDSLQAKPPAVQKESEGGESVQAVVLEQLQKRKSVELEMLARMLDSAMKQSTKKEYHVVELAFQKIAQLEAVYRDQLDAAVERAAVAEALFFEKEKELVSIRLELLQTRNKRSMQTELMSKHLESVFERENSLRTNLEQSLACVKTTCELAREKDHTLQQLQKKKSSEVELLAKLLRKQETRTTAHHGAMNMTLEDIKVKLSEQTRAIQEKLRILEVSSMEQGQAMLEKLDGCHEVSKKQFHELEDSTKLLLGKVEERLETPGNKVETTTPSITQSFQEEDLREVFGARSLLLD